MYLICCFVITSITSCFSFNSNSSVKVIIKLFNFKCKCNYYIYVYKYLGVKQNNKYYRFIMINLLGFQY